MSGMPFLFSSTLTLATSLFFFTFFKTFQSLCFGVRFKVSVWFSFRVSAWFSVRVSFRVSFRISVRVALGLALGLA